MRELLVCNGSFQVDKRDIDLIVEGTCRCLHDVAGVIKEKIEEIEKFKQESTIENISGLAKNVEEEQRLEEIQKLRKTVEDQESHIRMIEDEKKVSNEKRDEIIKRIMEELDKTAQEKAMKDEEVRKLTKYAGQISASYEKLLERNERMEEEIKH